MEGKFFCNGSVDELVDKANKATSIVRGFIYTLLRRGLDLIMLDGLKE